MRGQADQRLTLERLASSIVARAGHAYPLKSGTVRLGNSAPLRWLAAQLSWPRTARMRDGSRLLVLNDYMGRAIYFFGDIDPKVSWVLRRLLRAGDQVLDVGANVGLVSLLAARRVGPTGNVHAFEPQANLVAMIRRSAALNRLENLVVHPVALSDADSHTTLTIPKDNLGAASLGTPSEGGPFHETVVETRAASEYLSGLRLAHVRLLKVDIEGHEPVLFGAARDWLADHRPDVILFEEKGRPALDQPAVGLLAQEGYTVLALPKAVVRLRPVPLRPADEREVRDLVAVHRGPRHADILRALRV